MKELFVEPLPEGADREGALYPDGAHITDLKEVRGILYKMQRPAIAPQVGTILFFSHGVVRHLSYSWWGTLACVST